MTLLSSLQMNRTGASTLMRCFSLPLSGLKYYVKFRFKAVPVLAVFYPGTPLVKCTCTCCFLSLQLLLLVIRSLGGLVGLLGD